jgi:hypothetical protein
MDAKLKRSMGWTKVLAFTASIAVGLVSCHSEVSVPCPVYMVNHSGYRLCVEISQTQEFCEDTEVFYYLDDSDSLSLGYYPRGYSFWLWGWRDEPRAADTTSHIDDLVHVSITGKTLLLLTDSLGEPVLRVVH